MYLQLLKRIDELFKEELSDKTNWGRNQIIEIYTECVNRAVIEQLDELTKQN